MATPRERPDVELLAEVGAVAQLAAARLERALPSGMSAASFETLNALAAQAGPSAPLGLARSLGVSKAAMTNTLQRLEAAGWAAVAADPHDGRRKQVTLTPDGVAARRAALVAVRPQLEALRAGFEAWEFEAALPFLRRLSAWLRDQG